MKIQKKIGGGGFGGGGVRWGWGLGVGSLLGGSGWGDQGGCERRIEVFVKIQKKNLRGGPGGGGGSGGGSGWWGGGQVGCE